MKNTIVITGANRGLGLEFVKQFLKQDAFVYACCRQPELAVELQRIQESHDNIEIHKLDITVSTDISVLHNKITRPVDILINNAGFLDTDRAFGDLSVETMARSFLINAVGPIKLTHSLVPHLSKSERKLVVAITSKMGSITDNMSGGYYSYRAAKAALNMLMKSAAVDMKEQHIKVLLLHPGWVKTRMGGEEASLEIEQSVQGMCKVIANYAPPLGLAQFFDYKGEEIGW